VRANPSPYILSILEAEEKIKGYFVKSLSSTFLDLLLRGSVGLEVALLDHEGLSAADRQHLVNLVALAGRGRAVGVDRDDDHGQLTVARSTPRSVVASAGPDEDHRASRVLCIGLPACQDLHRILVAGDGLVLLLRRNEAIDHAAGDVAVVPVGLVVVNHHGEPLLPQGVGTVLGGERIESGQSLGGVPRVYLCQSLLLLLGQVATRLDLTDQGLDKASIPARSVIDLAVESLQLGQKVTVDLRLGRVASLKVTDALSATGAHVLLAVVVVEQRLCEPAVRLAKIVLREKVGKARAVGNSWHVILSP